MSSAEQKLGKSLDQIIAENKPKLGSGRGGASKAKSTNNSGSKRTQGRKKGRAGIRVTGARKGLKGIAGQPRREAEKNVIVVGNTKYIKVEPDKGLRMRGAGVSKPKREGVAIAANILRNAVSRPLNPAPARVSMGSRLIGANTGVISGRQVPRGNPEGKWAHDLFDHTDKAPPRRTIPAAAPASVRSVTTKLLISNLDPMVSREDLEELFMSCGAVTSVVIHYDRSDRPVGTAHVVFRDRKAAENAVSTYNGVKLDNRALKIDFDDGRVRMLSSGKSVEFPKAPPAPVMSTRSPPSLRGGRGAGGIGRLRSSVVQSNKADYMQE